MLHVGWRRGREGSEIALTGQGSYKGGRDRPDGMLFECIGYDGLVEGRKAVVKAEYNRLDISPDGSPEILLRYHYNHWIYNLLRDYVGDDVIEVGAGIGNITRFLLNAESITCLEPTPVYQKYLTARFEAHRNVRVLCKRIEDCPADGAEAGSYDTVICLNVLEHIENDVEALEKMGMLLKAG